MRRRKSACQHLPAGERRSKSHLLTDGFAGYRGRDAALGEHLRHTPVIQDEGANAGEFFPIIHTLFSNIKAWLVGTHHGVSAKHLPRYLAAGVVLPVQSPQPARWFGRLSHPARRRMRHHYL
jgi:hypothetical protein